MKNILWRIKWNTWYKLINLWRRPKRVWVLRATSKLDQSVDLVGVYSKLSWDFPAEDDNYWYEFLGEYLDDIYPKGDDVL
jgi:hypothetical protein